MRSLVSLLSGALNFGRSSLDLQAPVKKPPAASLMKEEATDSLIQLLTQFTQVEDPDLLLRKLGVGRDSLRKLETDDEISGALETRREAMMSVDWHLDPKEGEEAEWLEAHLSEHLDTIMRSCWSAIPYGYSVQEAVYHYGETRRIEIDHITLKPLEWFEPTREGTLIMRLPGSASSKIVDTRYKFFTTIRNPTYRNPYGEALLSRCYWPWFFRENGWRFWMRFLERFGDPLLMGQVSDPQAFVDAMKGLGMDAIVGVGMEESITAVTPSGRGEFSVVEEKLIQRIQRLILGQTASSGDASGWSKGQIQEEVRQDKRNSDIRLVSRSIQNIVRALWELNQFAGEPPDFVMEDALGLEPERAERDATLVNAGILKLTAEYLLNNYDYEEGDFVIEESQEEAPGNPQEEEEDPTLIEDMAARGSRFLALPGKAGEDLARRRKSQRFTPDQEELEELITSTVRQAHSPIPPATIWKAIEASESPEDLAERLAAIYLGDDPVAFRHLLEQALFSADVLGYVNAETKRGGG
jgi:phage gp29-like protein